MILQPDRLLRKPFVVAALLMGPATVVLATVPLLPGPRFLSYVGHAMISASVFAILPFIVAVLGSPFYLLMTVSRSRRRWAGQRFLLWISVAILLGSAIFGGIAVRNTRFVSAARRAEPLIQAIEAYRSARGAYPESLKQLVPSRLPQVPGTGMMLYPDFTYRRAGPGDDRIRSYQLMVPCSSGGINFDVFVYWPESDYPDFMYGGSVQRIGDWAYVHE